MKIKEKKINDFHKLISISLEEIDYSKNYNNSISKHSKTISLNGFRKGFVPKGLINKLYGKSVLAEELNRLFSQKLNDHVFSKKYKLIGEPIPVNNIKEDEMIFGNTITLDFEIGLAPNVDLKSIKNKLINYFNIKPNSSDVEKYIDSLRKRYGNMTSPEIVENEDVLTGEFIELNNNNKKLENGIIHSGSISLISINNKKQKEIFIGLKKHKKIIITDIRKMFHNEADLCSLLNIKKDKLNSISSIFSFELKNIQRVKMSVLNKDFFNKVYPDNKIQDYLDFEKNIEQEMSANYIKDTDMFFKYNVYDDIIKNIKIPDDFLKKWLLSKEVISGDDMAKEYDNYSRYFKTQLIDGSIVESNKIEVLKKDLEEAARQHVLDQFKYYGNRNINKDHLRQFTKQILENKEELKRLNEVVINNKIISCLKNHVKIKEKYISINEFIKLADKYKK